MQCALLLLLLRCSHCASSAVSVSALFSRQRSSVTACVRAATSPPSLASSSSCSPLSPVGLVLLPCFFLPSLSCPPFLFRTFLPSLLHSCSLSLSLSPLLLLTVLPSKRQAVTAEHPPPHPVSLMPRQGKVRQGVDVGDRFYFKETWTTTTTTTSRRRRRVSLRSDVPFSHEAGRHTLSFCLFFSAMAQEKWH